VFDDSRERRKAAVLPLAGQLQPVAWRPSADVYRVAGGWLVKFDLAGVKLDELQVSLSGCRLTVRGSRRDWLIPEAASCYSLEIAYSAFERTLDFPCEVEQAHMEWEYRDGMLLVRLHTEAPG
jgi:HSP20 family protein